MCRSLLSSDGSVAAITPPCTYPRSTIDSSGANPIGMGAPRKDDDGHLLEDMDAGFPLVSRPLS